MRKMNFVKELSPLKPKVRLQSFTEFSQSFTEKMENNDITDLVIGAAIEVHRTLGPGLLESAYQECLYYELQRKKLLVRKEIALPIVYKEVKLNHGYRIDLLVEDRIVIEIKTVECFTDVHLAQVLTYLRLGGFELGLLINFHTTLLKNGIKRIINKPL